MRAWVGMLLGVNLAFFVWTQGWLSPWLPAPWQGQREPQRLLEQVHPERVAVRRAAAASDPAAVEAAPGATASPAAAGSAPTASPARSGR